MFSACFCCSSVPGHTLGTEITVPVEHARSNFLLDEMFEVQNRFADCPILRPVYHPETAEPSNTLHLTLGNTFIDYISTCRCFINCALAFPVLMSPESLNSDVGTENSSYGSNVLIYIMSR